MRRVRVIPVLLIQDKGLVKSIKFKKHKYVGDPINAVKIFNEKEVDEIIILDIFASKYNRKPNIKQISEIASEAFMPLAYGGGITTLEEVKNILFCGVEKVIINTSAIEKETLVSQIANQFGSQSIVVSIDVKKDMFGRYKVYKNNGTKNTKKNPVDFAKKVESLGAGEIFINSIDKDGTFGGFDIDIIKNVSNAVKIPVVACGGASEVSDFKKAVQLAKASAVAAGSMFVFQRPHRAVLISYPNQELLYNELFSKI